MKTLKELIADRKCRKGAAAGTTKRGAYWLACEPIKIRSYGGDGIGQSAPDIDHHLELRHYRSGEIRAMVCRNARHQNSGTSTRYSPAELLDCTTSEQVIVALKGSQVECGYDYSEHAYSDYFADSLTKTLAALGMPDSEPAPDEQPA